ncbi:putative LRR receptor-like serine/threonine-protein kinase [Prunus yedoensis var. nudiflora]|uniref:Putative LRR receptor-like serine/threonine-protein kinase n=1 Tax=Prunus yedoensis var. nudiflora TaxID=2094558 RepID=A0A314UFA7_PRUYE|nr:putative LRR receptor-like serine/threonine-protein kinase [Prunus yedoensis var. nudiflora]PQM41129.1 putative LRR receptor-like serine/threonine-protein kinase [Prunus yedoensis var. nudiflora]
MSLCLFLLWLVTIPLLAYSQSNPRGYLLNCGAGSSSGNDVTVGSLKYITDEGFISVGSTSTIKQDGLVPILTTLRYFPDKSARKYCYTIPVIRGGKYLVRTTYYYGGFDGGKEPPVFDQIVEGTKWSVVNTTEDHAKGMSSYYEIVVQAKGKALMYNATDFNKYALTTVARSSFGDDGDIIGFPDDKFNRLWQPYKDQNPVVNSKHNVTPSDFWNIPPAKIFQNSFTASRGKPLQIKWPAGSLPSASYYIALYFQDNRNPSPLSWRVFNVSVNDKNFYANVNVSTRGLTVYAPQWPLSGQTQIVLTPGQGIPVGPVISAGEIMQILPLGGVTINRDVGAMNELRRYFDNPPPDWSGDPCLPGENSWTGVTCTPGKQYRVTALNLTGIGLSGSLAPNIANLTALHHIWLGGNKLSGNIPEMGSLKELQSLHLENNQLEGLIPQSLRKLPKLREIFLQNNKVKGDVPHTPQDKKKNIQLKNDLDSGSQSPARM